MKNFVLTGTCYGATHYSALLLTAAGAPCSHEQRFNPLLGRYRFHRMDDCPGESSWTAAWYLDELDDDILVFHQVRHPVKVVRSLVGSTMFHPDCRTAHRRWFGEILPGFTDGGELVTCMRFWSSWHNLISEHHGRCGSLAGSCGTEAFRVEDLNEVRLAGILKAVGTEPDDGRISCALEAVPKNIAKRATDSEKQSISWTTLPDCAEKRRMGELAEEYGYDPAEDV